ncbi:MAG: DUF6463 family protein [Bacteroidota bacterium]
MKISHGKIILGFGVLHTLLAISPLAFGEQFVSFSKCYFFNISDGLLEFPFLNGQMHYENFAAFWFFYFGLLLLPLGVVVHYLEQSTIRLPATFVGVYLMVVLIGVFMIPLSGMTFLMLPHALWMVYQLNLSNKSSETS